MWQVNFGLVPPVPPVVVPPVVVPPGDPLQQYDEEHMVPTHILYPLEAIVGSELLGGSFAVYPSSVH